ncbi:MAG: hypothetical protein Q9186_006350 [Xanthomendoza sp. 1 TL-2023]
MSERIVVLELSGWSIVCLRPTGVISDKGVIETRSDPEYVKEACNKSLKRLGIDCIDLYYCHVSSYASLIEGQVILGINAHRGDSE